MQPANIPAAASSANATNAHNNSAAASANGNAESGDLFAALLSMLTQSLGGSFNSDSETKQDVGVEANDNTQLTVTISGEYSVATDAAAQANANEVLNPTTEASSSGATVTHTPGQPAVVVLPDSSHNDSPIRGAKGHEESNVNQPELTGSEKSIDVRPSVTTATTRSHVETTDAADAAPADNAQGADDKGEQAFDESGVNNASTQGMQHRATVQVVETESGRTITVTKDEVVRQVVEIVRPAESTADGAHRISLKLRPAELGTLQVTMEVRHHDVHVRIQADNPETARLIVESIGDLRSEMENLGYSNSQFDVHTNQQNNSHSQGVQHAANMSSLNSETDEVVLAELRALASRPSDSELDVKV